MDELNTTTDENTSVIPETEETDEQSTTDLNLTSGEDEMEEDEEEEIEEEEMEEDEEEEMEEDEEDEENEADNDPEISINETLPLDPPFHSAFSFNRSGYNGFLENWAKYDTSEASYDVHPYHDVDDKVQFVSMEDAEKHPYHFSYRVRLAGIITRKHYNSFYSSSFWDCYAHTDNFTKLDAVDTTTPHVNSKREDGLFYKFFRLREDGEVISRSGTEGVWKVSETRTIPDGIEIVACSRGYHASSTVSDAFRYVPGDVFGLVRLAGDSSSEGDKIAARVCTLEQLIRVDDTFIPSLLEFAQKEGLSESACQRFQTYFTRNSSPDLIMGGWQSGVDSLSYSDYSVFMLAFEKFTANYPSYDASGPRWRFQPLLQKIAHVKNAYASSLRRVDELATYQAQQLHEAREDIAKRSHELVTLLEEISGIIRTSEVEEIVTTTTTTKRNIKKA